MIPFVEETGVSERIMAWRSIIEESSSLKIEGPLNPEEWEDLMSLLRYADVSRIEHLIFSIDDWDLGPWWKLAADRVDKTGLGTVLGTGRFSALKRLEIDINDRNLLFHLDPRLVIDGDSELTVKYGSKRFLPSPLNLGIGSESIAAAFRTGHFADLRELHLSVRLGTDFMTDPREVKFAVRASVCDAFDFNHIFEAMVEGGISKLTSLSIHYCEYFRSVSQKLDALLKSECLRNLHHLTISGDIFGQLEWKVFIAAIKSGLLPKIRSFVLRDLLLKQRLILADFVEASGNWFSSLQNLTLLKCGVTSQQVCAMVDAIMKLTEPELALEILNLNLTFLPERAVYALANLLESGRLPQLQNLDLSSNSGIQSVAVLTRLMETIQGGCLPRLKELGWIHNTLGSDDEGAQAIVKAYFENEALTAGINIDWDLVRDRSLEAKVKKYKERNARLVALRTHLEDEFKVLVPLTSAKMFLCGYPEVGKTTLRKTLGRHSGFRTRFMLERHPKRSKEPRTKGIEVSRIQGKNNITLILWDLAGQEEFHVLHGTFLADLGFAGGKATTFVLVFKVPFEENVQAKLMYWLKFVASSSLKHVKRQVMIVLNCFDGKQCLESDRRYWMGLIADFAAKFIDTLYIHPDPFLIDVRVAALVQPLKDYLFNQARTLLQDVEVPKACFELLGDLKQWAEGVNKSRLPIFTWQAFVEGWKLKHSVQGDPPKNLKICASYLHEIGEIIYLAEKESTQPRSGNKSIVVPDPEWFCKQVVGQLLLPKDMLEGGSSIQVSEDGSISLVRFRAFFEHLLPYGTESHDVISMLEQIGLCYRKSLEEIVIPALIREDDYKSMDWEGQGFHGVMGRCLATEDKDRCAIPGTLFRRLQVELAQDPNLGGRSDSKYRAGKSFSSFKLGELLVLVQFDVDHSDPSDDRIDISVKSVLRVDSTDVCVAKVNIICEIIQKLERLSVVCCPGLSYDIKIIQPWNATEGTPKMTERQLMSLTEIKALLVKGHKYSSWKLNDDPLELKTFLTESELKEVLGSAQREYDECKREAVWLGLLTEDFLRKLEYFDREDGANAQSPDVEVAETKYQNEAGADVTNREILLEIQQQHHLTRKAVHDDGDLTRKYIEKSHQVLLLEIRNKHCVLVSHIQAQQEFSNEERSRSVPRYVFLSRRQGKSNRWITLKEAFHQSFELHLLCEARFDDGFLHEVEGQEGVRLTKPKEWLVKISPWVRRSLQVALMVGKAVGNIYLPGVFSFIPDVDYLQNDGEGSSKAANTAATMMLEEDEGVMDQVRGDHSNYGTAGSPVDLRERMIAEGVVKDLINELGEAAFQKKIGLRKVLLRATSQSHIGCSTQAQSSESQSSVRWICHSCYKCYGDRARAIA